MGWFDLIQRIHGNHKSQRIVACDNIPTEIVKICLQFLKALCMHLFYYYHTTIPSSTLQMTKYFLTNFLLSRKTPDYNLYISSKWDSAKIIAKGELDFLYWNEVEVRKDKSWHCQSMSFNISIFNNWCC